MSDVNYSIPWAEGKIRLLDITETASQGQLIAADGSLATKGTSGGADSKAAKYVLGADVTTSGRKGVYQDCVVRTDAIAAGSTGDPVYLGADGAYTLSEPVAGDSDLKQEVGFVRSDGNAQINLYSQTTAQPMYTDYTPTLVWGTADPASITLTGRYREFANRVEGEVTISSADGNGATSLTVSLPVAMKNNSGAETAIVAQQLQNTTWTDAFGYADQADSLIKFEAFTTCTDAQACEFKIKFTYEKASSIITAWTDWTVVPNWTGSAPAGLVEDGRYYIENNTLHFELTMSSADPGGAATALTIDLPQTAVGSSGETGVNAQQLDNTTWLNPFGAVDKATSKITFEAFAATADDEPFELKITGSYEV